MTHETNTLKDKYLLLRTEELKQLIDPETKMLRKDISEDVTNCPVCLGENKQHFFEKEGFTFSRCNTCDGVFVDPRVSEEFVQKYYRKFQSIDFWTEVLCTEEQMRLSGERFSRALEMIETTSGGKGKLLDIGCSIGLLIKLANERGWDAIGLELNENAVEFGKNRFGVTIHKKLLHEINFPEASFDAVTIMAVLEHLPHPRDMVLGASKILKTGGLLYVFVPNMNSLAFRVLHEKTFTVDGRNHLVYFNPENLSKMLEDFGFEIVFRKTEGSSIMPVLRHTKFLHPYLDTSDIKLSHLLENSRPSVGEYLKTGLLQLSEDQLNNLMERTVEKLDLGYYLHICARKKG